MEWNDYWEWRKSVFEKRCHQLGQMRDALKAEYAEREKPINDAMNELMRENAANLPRQQDAV